MQAKIVLVIFSAALILSGCGTSPYSRYRSYRSDPSDNPNADSQLEAYKRKRGITGEIPAHQSDEDDPDNQYSDDSNLYRTSSSSKHRNNRDDFSENDERLKWMDVNDEEVSWATKMLLDGNKEEGKQALLVFAEGGNPVAMFMLSLFFLDETYGEFNSDQAYHWAKRAYDAGYPEASWTLSKAFLFGWGVRKDLDKSNELLVEGIRKGCRHCTSRLARNFYFGVGVDADKNEACRLYRECDSHGTGLRECSLGLATCYIQGTDNTSVDYQKALHILNQPRLGDSTKATYLKAYLYERGWGVPKRTDLALESYQETCKQRYGLGCFGIGRIHYFGDGVTQDKAKGMTYIHQAADLGATGAMTLYGYWLIALSDSPDKKGMDYLHRAAEFGDNDAHRLLGGIYLIGNSVVEKSLSKASKHLYTAARSGDSKAMMAYVYALISEGVPPQSGPHGDKAYYWVEKAYNMDNPDALFLIGLYKIEKENEYLTGLRDIRKAASMGNKKAIEYLEKNGHN